MKKNNRTLNHAINYLSQINDLNIIKEDKIPLKSVEQLKLILPRNHFI